jgi:hypothetical protein
MAVRDLLAGIEAGGGLPGESGAVRSCLMGSSGTAFPYFACTLVI